MSKLLRNWRSLRLELSAAQLRLPFATPTRAFACSYMQMALRRNRVVKSGCARIAAEGTSLAGTSIKSSFTLPHSLHTLSSPFYSFPSPSLLLSPLMFSLIYAAWQRVEKCKNAWRFCHQSDEPCKLMRYSRLHAAYSALAIVSPGNAFCDTVPHVVACASCLCSLLQDTFVEKLLSWNLNRIINNGRTYKIRSKYYKKRNIIIIILYHDEFGKDLGVVHLNYFCIETCELFVIVHWERYLWISR